MLDNITWDEREIERRKQTMRDLWAYKRVDHIPVVIWLVCNPRGYTIKELLEDGEKQLEANLVAVERCLRTLPDDYIPWLRPDVGYMTVATVYGCEVYWNEKDPDQMPGVEVPIIHDMAQVYELERPDPATAGLMPECLRRIRLFVERTKGQIPLTGIDMGGPLNTCKDLIETNLMYTAFYDSPEEFHYLLDHITGTMIACYDLIIQAAGGLDKMTTTDFDPTWAPEGHKGFCSDDVCATIRPRLFETFGQLYNSRIYARYGGGLLHNCGPHPAADLYLDHAPPIKGLNCSWRYTRNDMEKLRRAFAGRGLVFAMFDNEETPEEMMAGYAEMAEALAPDTIGLPVCIMDGEAYSDGDILETYLGLRKISEEYAANLRWSEDGS